MRLEPDLEDAMNSDLNRMSPFYVMDVLDRAKAMEAKGDDIVHLEVGEPDFDLHPLIEEAVRRAYAEKRTHYTDSAGDAELREAVCRLYKAEYGVDVTPDRVIVTSGSSPALTMGVMAVCDAGEEVLVSNPGYPCYRNFALAAHAGEFVSGEALAEECGVLGQVFLTGVFKSEVERVRADAPMIPYYLNININPFLKYSVSYAHRLVKSVQQLGAVGMNCNHMNATHLLVHTFHKHDLLVSIWTVRSDSQMKKVLRLAPDNMTTTLPDLARQAVAEGKA